MANDEEDSIRSLLEGAVDGTITTETGSRGGPPEDLTPDAGKPAAAPADNGQGADQSDAAKAHRAEQAASRARDEAGRFAAKPADAKPARETLKVKDPAVAAAVTAEVAATGMAKPPEERAEDKAAAALLTPPADWKGAAKIKWEKLPSQVQEQIQRDYASVAAARAEIEPLQRALAPHREVLVRDAGSIESGIGQLMEFYNLFLTRPVDLIQHIARTRGINLGQQPAPPAGQPDQGTPPATAQVPDFDSIIEQRLQQKFAPIQAHFAQAETQQLQSAIEAFRADPKHPYFEDVKVHMGQLLNIGAAKDMQAAYDQAIWADPVIRQQLLEAQAESTKTAQAAEVQRARDAAAASLRGSPLANGATAPAGGGSDGSIRGDLMAAIRQQQGAV